MVLNGQSIDAKVFHEVNVFRQMIRQHTKHLGDEGAKRGPYFLRIGTLTFVRKGSIVLPQDRLRQPAHGCKLRTERDRQRLCHMIKDVRYCADDDGKTDPGRSDP